MNYATSVDQILSQLQAKVNAFNKAVKKITGIVHVNAREI